MLASLPEEEEEASLSASQANVVDHADDDDTQKEAEASAADRQPPQQQQGLHTTRARQDDDDDDGATDSLEGVLFGRSVRGHYVSLNLVVVRGDADSDADSDPQQANNNNTAHSKKDDDDDRYHVLVRIQFDTPDDGIIKDLRSYFRRHCKNGDLITLRRGVYQDCLLPNSNNSNNHHDTNDADTTITTTITSATPVDGSWTEPRFVVHVQSIPEAQESFQVQQVRYWTQSQWQAWQHKYDRQKQRQQQPPKQQNPKNHGNTATSEEGNDNNCQAHHAGGLEKRQQSEMVATFLFRMMMTTQQQKQKPKCTTLATGASSNSAVDSRSRTGVNGFTSHVDPQSSQDAEQQLPSTSAETTRDYLNGGAGVLDVAGGSGLVSMALGLMGIQSTVVDPREAVGRLPGRDRKVWNRALKKKRKASHATPLATVSPVDHPQQQQQPQPPTCFGVSPSSSGPLMCQPVTPQVRPFQTMRAWFGAPPVGVDTAFRNPDNATVPVCDARHALLQDCRAIVALHPDEATDAIVDTAVQCQIPFVIVPCCVFCRLFPHRRMPSGEMVSTYPQLLDYLQAKHPSIQRTTLPFVGANTVLYSTFQ